jgi:hypothetical protein
MREVSAALIELASRPMGINRAEAAEALAIAEINASAYLCALTRAGKLKRVRGGKASRYCLPDKANTVALYVEEYEHERDLETKVRTVPQGKWKHKPCKGQVSSVWDLAK